MTPPQRLTGDMVRRTAKLAGRVSGAAISNAVGFIFSWNEFGFAVILARPRCYAALHSPILMGGHNMLGGDTAAIATIGVNTHC